MTYLFSRCAKIENSSTRVINRIVRDPNVNVSSRELPSNYLRTTFELACSKYPLFAPSFQQASRRLDEGGIRSSLRSSKVCTTGMHVMISGLIWSGLIWPAHHPSSSKHTSYFMRFHDCRMRLGIQITTYEIYERYSQGTLKVYSGYTPCPAALLRRSLGAFAR